MGSRITSRRRFMMGSASTLAAGAAAPAFATRVLAQAPAPARITPELVEAARKEGKIVWYTSVDLPVAEKVAKAFEAKFAGIAVRVERTGAERVFQRIGQETASRIYACDVVQSSDAAHYIVWKRDGLLTPYVSEDVAAHYPAEHRDADGMFASWRVWLSPIAYNTRLVKAEDVPKGFMDLLDPKWSGKIVKAHPGYSGTIMTATFQIARDLGWEYFEKLAKQRVMQLQSAADPPKKVALGERAIMADGADYAVQRLKDNGDPIEIVYAVEGTPLIVGPAGIMKAAPNPNAARLFHNWSLTAEGQQFNVDVGALYSAHPNVKERPGRKPLKDIKLMKDDAAAVERMADEIKTRYTQIFKV